MISSIPKNDSNVFNRVDGVTAESYTKTIIRTLSEIFEDEDESQAGPYSIEELTLKYASARERETLPRSIMSPAATILSLVPLWMIRRSHVGLSSKNNRLLFISLQRTEGD